MDRGAQWATVHGAAKSRTRLCMHARLFTGKYIEEQSIIKCLLFVHSFSHSINLDWAPTMCQPLSLHSLVLLSAMSTEARSDYILDDLPKEKQALPTCWPVFCFWLFFFFLHFQSILESSKRPEVYLVATIPHWNRSQACSDSLQWPVASMKPHIQAEILQNHFFKWVDRLVK